MKLGRRQRGQSITEYLVVAMLLVVALASGPDSALQRLFEAFGDYYERFSYEASRP